MRLKNFIAPALAAAVVLATHLPSVSAQDEGGRRGGQGGRPGAGGFGGPGGFGGGAMFGRGGVAGGDMILVSLLGRETVREELKLDADQLAGLEKLAGRLRPERPEFDFRTASEAQRTAFVAKMQEEAAARASEAKSHVEELLLPDQMERLQQIALQVQGPSALVNPDVAKELELGDDKVAELKKTIAENAEKTREMMTAAMRERNFDTIREKTQEMRKELDEKLVSQLSSDQQAKFEEMKGVKFDMPEGGAFGRGGPGGGQRGAGGPDGPRRRGGEGEEGGRRGGQRGDR